MSYLPLKYEVSNIFPKKSVAIRPNVHIMLSSGTLPDRLERNTGTTSPVFELSYSRRDTLRGEVDRTPVELRTGYASLGFMDAISGRSEYDGGAEVMLYSIWVGPEAFDGFCRAVCGERGVGFRSFLSGAYHCRDFKNDARDESILNRLDLSLGADADRLNRLLLESQVLELLSLNIERLLGLERLGNRLAELTKADVERLLRAREILLNRLEEPPSLLELSRMLQTNDCKLKRSFKLYFGKTVYEFVREQRMERAYSLLRGGEYNVSQAAFTVGYTNISHFSQSFKEWFGVSPREVK